MNEMNNDAPHNNRLYAEAAWRLDERGASPFVRTWPVQVRPRREKRGGGTVLLARGGVADRFAQPAMGLVGVDPAMP
jgi:hypothetical protein